MNRLLSYQASPEEFSSILQHSEWPEDSLLMAFSINRFWFEPYKDQSGYLVQTEQGRIFSPRGELKWRYVNQGYRMVYLGEGGPEPMEDLSYELEGLTASTRTFFLWGVRTDFENEWIEQQVPHRFEYPVYTAEYSRGRVKLQVQEWKNRAGVPCFARYHSLQEVEGVENAKK